MHQDTLSINNTLIRGPNQIQLCISKNALRKQLCAKRFIALPGVTARNICTTAYVTPRKRYKTKRKQNEQSECEVCHSAGTPVKGKNFAIERLRSHCHPKLSKQDKHIKILHDRRTVYDARMVGLAVDLSLSLSRSFSLSRSLSLSLSSYVATRWWQLLWRKLACLRSVSCRSRSSRCTDRPSPSESVPFPSNEGAHSSLTGKTSVERQISFTS